MQKGRFGTLLGMTPEELGGTLRVEALDDRESLVSLAVPSWCCQDGRLRLAAAVAMVDEASTYAGACAWDARRRAGVSIQLAGRAANARGRLDAGPGDRIGLRTTRVRVGRTIAFLKARVERGDHVLAQCSHVKFLPGGFLRDNLFHPLVRGVTVPAIDRIAGRLPLHERGVPDNIDDIFDLSFSGNDTESASTMAVSERHGNPMGSIHGGASVVLANLGAERWMRQGDPAAATRPLWIKTNLVQGIDCASGQTATLSVSEERDDTLDRINSTNSIMTNNGNVCADTVIGWSL